MRTFTRACTVMLFLATAASVSAQPAGPGGPGGRPGPRGRGAMPGVMRPGPSAGPIGGTADFLLAHTGDLALTDAQVVRLAAISRRTDARRKAMVARMDSARAAARSASDDSARAGRGRGPAGLPPAELQQLREQMRTDVRDAISVLTADQQATAWMMIAGGGPLGGGPDEPVGRGGAAGRAGAGEAPPNRGSISRPPPARDVPRRPDDTDRPTP